MGHEDTAAAADRLTLLRRYHLAPAPPRPDGQPRAAIHPTARAPVDLALIDYVTGVVAEAAAFVHATTPPDQPLPAGPGPDRLYDWIDAHTGHLDTARAAARDALVYRQALEHALRAGDETVIRREACPACGCLGLFWSPERQRARCAYAPCRTKGRPSTWTLAQLATAHVRTVPGQKTAT